MVARLSMLRSKKKSIKVRIEGKYFAFKEEIAEAKKVSKLYRYVSRCLLKCLR